MLARLMPTQQQTDVKVEHRYQTFEEIAARLRELGVEPRRIYPLLTDEKNPRMRFIKRPTRNFAGPSCRT
jgi:hypothetical protein